MKKVLVLIVVLLITGCNDEVAFTPANSVEWYESNPDEMKAMVKRCADNPGELKDAPNCVNARNAMRKQASRRSKLDW